MKQLLLCVLSLCLLLPVASVTADESSQFGMLAAVDTVDINSADVAALASLKGVGLKKAEAIIAWRDTYGPFRQIDDLLQIRGIGSSILEANRDKIRLE